MSGSGGTCSGFIRNSPIKIYIELGNLPNATIHDVIIPLCFGENIHAFLTGANSYYMYYNKYNLHKDQNLFQTLLNINT